MDVTAHLESVLEALRTIRSRRVGGEVAYLQPLVADALAGAGIGHEMEVSLGPRARVDFLTGGGVAVEVKRGRPKMASLLSQLGRYAGSDRIAAVVLVLERSVPLPDQLDGKPIRCVSLNMLWGPAV